MLVFFWMFLSFDQLLQLIESECVVDYAPLSQAIPSLHYFHLQLVRLLQRIYSLLATPSIVLQAASWSIQ